MNTQVDDFISFLPPIVWYLTAHGTDMWCRRPYGFLFSTREAAEAFVIQVGSEFDLVPIGISSLEVVSDAGLAGLRQLALTRLFLDPQIEADTGDVVGTILRLEDVH